MSRRGRGGADLMKMWMIGVVSAVAIGFAAGQVEANHDTTAGMIARPLFEQLAPIFVWLGVIYGVILLAATVVYLIRRGRA